jgi:kumamolisin
VNKFLSAMTALALGASLCTPVLARPISSPVRPLPPAQFGAGSDRTVFEPTANLERMLGAKFVEPAKFPGMSVDVETPLRNRGALAAYARQASIPGSYYYRHWLTPAQIADAFGTPKDQYGAILREFRHLGFAAHPWPTRNLITVTGSQARFESLLGTTFGAYAVSNQYTHRYLTFTAPSTALHISSPLLRGLRFHKLVSLQLKRRHFMVTSPPEPINEGFSNARVNGASPAQISRAFDYTGAYEAGFTGKGINLGIIGTGPISADDVPNYRRIYKVPGTSTVTIDAAKVNGDTTPPAVTGPCGSSTLGSISPIGDPTQGSSTSPTATCNPEDIEAQLDTEQTSSLAYDANVLFYLAYNGTECEVENNPLGGCIGPDATSQGLDLSDDELMQAVNDDKADILSLSFGGCEALETATMELTPTPGGDATGTDPTIFAMLAAEGIAVFVSSGDSGSASCQAFGMDEADVNYPASDPNVVAVGGTTTPMGADGLLTGPITTWGEQTESGGAEGAGTSVDFATPSFQSSESATCTMRCVPDVVMDADPFSGAAVVFDSGIKGTRAAEEPVGGTSQAAPDMAAMWALVLSACKATPKCGGGYGGSVTDPSSGYKPPAAPAYRLGNPNFLWYKLAPSTQAANYHQVFYDIVYGNDGVPPFAALEASSVAGGEGANVSAYSGGIDPGSVNAGPGVDEASGLGSPFGRALITYAVGI